MLRIHQIKLSLDEMQNLTPQSLRKACARALKLPPESIREAVLRKRSVDARDKGDVHFTLTCDVALTDPRREEKLAAQYRPNQVALVAKNPPVNAESVRNSDSIPGLGRSPGGEHHDPFQLFLPGKSHGQRRLASYTL